MPKEISDEGKDVGHAKPDYKITPVGKTAMQGETAAGEDAKRSTADDKQKKVDTQEVDYSHPSGFRDGVRDKVWENAKKKITMEMFTIP